MDFYFCNFRGRRPLITLWEWDDLHGRLDDPGGNNKTEQVFKQALAECVKVMFNVTLSSFTPSGPGTNGQFVGSGTDVINNGGNDAMTTVTNNVTRFSSASLTFLKKGKLPSQDVAAVVGATFNLFKSGWFSPYTNYTANDLQGQSVILTNQVHELGHSLKFITGVATPPGSEEGGLLQDCVNQTAARLSSGQ